MQLCPPTKAYPKTIDGDCSNPEALKFVEERCHNQQLCSMTAAPEVFVAFKRKDRCRGVRRHVEVAFKCKPPSFRSKVACHSETLDLRCDPDKRLVIYSAAFSSAVGSHMFCSDAPSVDTNYDDYNVNDKYAVSDVAKCESSFATQAVMQMCHGKGESSFNTRRYANGGQKVI